jgi:hypothetical protein
MNMKLICLILLLSFVSCASYNPGEQATELRSDAKGDVLLTSINDDELSLPNLEFYNFYFENKSTEWRRIKKIEILGIKDHPEAKIIIGKDLNDWARAIEHKVKIDEYNNKIISSALAITGAGIAAVGVHHNSNSVGETGAVIGSGALAVLEAQEIFSKISDLERSSLIPTEHLLTPFAIPPQLVSTKWLLIQKDPETQINTIVLKITYEDETTTVFQQNY